MIDVLPADRVLFLTLPAAGQIADVAARLCEGLVVGIGDDDAVHRVRRELRDAVNVMIVPSAEDSALPWQDGFFTKVVELSTGWEDALKTARELARVLSPGGLLFLSNGFTATPDCLLPYFFKLAGEAGVFQVFQRIG